MSDGGFEASDKHVFSIWLAGILTLMVVILVTSLVPQTVREMLRVDYSFTLGLLVGIATGLMMVPALLNRAKDRADEEV